MAHHRLQRWLPPILHGPIKELTGRSNRYTGNYESWGAALADASGYDDGAILERVAAATRRVVSGEYAFEQDSVLFSQPEYPFHIIALLLKGAAERGDGKLSVLDYGGSLGSTFRRCRPFLDSLDVSWKILEQPKFVRAGKAEFETGGLQFYDQPENLLRAGPIDVAIFSSVTQYLENPLQALAVARESNARYLVIDRTPFHSRGLDDAICVQHVPRWIYAASYPMHVLSYPKLIAALQSDWSVIAEFVSAEGAARTSKGLEFEFRGLIVRKRNGN